MPAAKLHLSLHPPSLLLPPLYFTLPPTNPNLCSVPGISFIPREVGEHLVSIKKNGNHVANSPVSIMVVQSEIGDARRAKVYGRGLSEGRTFEMSDFIVDTRDAGVYGGGPRGRGPVLWNWLLLLRLFCLFILPAFFSF